MAVGGAARGRRPSPCRPAIGLALCLALSGAAPAAVAAADDTPQAADNTPSQATPTAKPPSKFRSPDDGALDFSGFLDKAYGFVPLLIPITEPAVGYGAGAGLVFIDKTRDDAQAGFGRPNMTVVGGLATENGTWGALAGDIRHWHDDRVQTVAGVIYASVNLDFYGIGKTEALDRDPLSYNLQPVGGGVRGRYRVGESRLWVGLSYVLAETKVRFDAPERLSGIPDFLDTSRIGGMTPSLAYDSRDNIFTPTRGTYVEGTAGLYDEALGGDTTFQRVGLTYIVYLPVHDRVTLGVRGGAAFAFGDAPFYMLPFVSLRGVPVMRYQGQDEAEVETEVRWQCWKRWSVVGFVGAGAAWIDLEHFDNEANVVAGGTGVRYELARKYGLHAGADVAFGPDGTAFYIQFGSAWARP